MSLIDEALKRAQAAQRDAGTPPAERPWTPAPLPDAGLARRRRFVRALGVLAALAALAAAALTFLRSPAARPSAVSVPRPAAVATRATAPPPSPTETRASAARPAAPAAASASGDRGTAAPPPAGSSEGRVPSAASEERPAEEPEPPAAPRPHGGLVAGKTYVGAVTLPSGVKIELGGIVWSEDEPRALLNDRVVGVGAVVESFTLTAIAEDRVILEKDGLKVTLALK